MATLLRWLAGLAVVLVGAWGGIVAYVGPWFGFRMTSTNGWVWTTANWELHLAPGAVAVLGGLLMMTPGLLARLGGWLAMFAGAWFVTGPLFASLWLGSGAETRVASTTLAKTTQPLGYHYGTGIVILVIAAWSLGRVVGWRRWAGASPAAGEPSNEDWLLEDLRTEG